MNTGSALARRVKDRALDALRGLTVPMAVLYLISSIFNIVVWDHSDLNFTVGSSYAYLFGHILDFYDYNRPIWAINDYFPTTYIVFALWMAPVKALVSPGVQNGINLSSAELIWARLLLLLLYWATFYVISLIAKELFPNRPKTQTTVRIAFLMSPFAAFAFNVHGQYDIIGVLFTSLGFLYYRRGDKWKFAIYFALAASCKYFALIVFIPLLVLQFKRFREMIPLGLVGLSVIAVEAAIYLPNAAFREVTLFRLLGEKVAGSETQTITSFLAILFVIGTILLWRWKPRSRDSFQLVAVHAALLAFGFMFASVVWHPYWFIVLAPFTALSIGYLRRPALFIIWESVAFVAYIWVVVNHFGRQIDVTLADNGAIRDVIPTPRLLLADFFDARALPLMNLLVLFYLISPVVFLLFERTLTVGGREIDPPVPRKSLWLRTVTLIVVWTLPCLVALYIPIRVAIGINPGAGVANMTAPTLCASQDTAYGVFTDGAEASETFTSDVDKLSAVSVSTGNYSHATTGTATAVVTDESGAEVARATYDLSRLTRDDWIYFVFSPVTHAMGKTFTVELTTSGTSPETGLALYGTAADCNPAVTTTWGGQTVAGDFHFTYYGLKP